MGTEYIMWWVGYYGNMYDVISTSIRWSAI